MRANASVFADRTHGLLFAAGDNLRRSTDDGKTWQIIIPPLQFELLAIDGKIYGAHDCSGTFYVVGTNIMRSEDGGNTFVSVQPQPLGGHYLFVKGWAFDRGSTVFWQNNIPPYVYLGPLTVSHDGINGLIKDSVRSAISVSSGDIVDTICSSAAALSIRVGSSICTGIRIDSISVLRAAGTIAKKIAAKTLFGDTTQFQLSYIGRAGGSDSLSLRVWFHSLEWGIKEFKDVQAIAENIALPAILAAPIKLDFGDVHIDSARQLTLQITNTGCTSLRIDSLISSNPALFSVSSQSYPLNIGKDTTRKITVTFVPKTRGAFIESIELGSSAGHRFIELLGNGIREEQGSVEGQPTETFAVYPNPASDRIDIRGLPHTAAIELRDLMGRMWFETSTQESSVSIPVRDIPPGLYVLHIGDRVVRIIIAR